jgi:hypothetical protein
VMKIIGMMSRGTEETVIGEKTGFPVITRTKPVVDSQMCSSS